MITEKVEALCREIMAQWERWEGEAMSAGQLEQSTEAYEDELLSHIRAAVLKHLSAGPPLTSGLDGRLCPRCGGQMAHYRLKGYRCPRCN